MARNFRRYTVKFLKINYEVHIEWAKGAFQGKRRRNCNIPKTIILNNNSNKFQFTIIVVYTNLFYKIYLPY
jgi:hypothetical protein